MSKTKKLNITSTAIEKGIDLAQSFLSKLLSPGIETAGLLIQDQVQHFRIKQQLKLLEKAKKYCDKNNISPKSIPVKILVPLLNDASLEEDDQMLDNWAILLSNMVDSEQNLQNHIFPSILGQLSLNEFEYLSSTHSRVMYMHERDCEELKKVSEELRIRKPIIEARLRELLKNNEATYPFYSRFTIFHPSYAEV